MKNGFLLPMRSTKSLRTWLLNISKSIVLNLCLKEISNNNNNNKIMNTKNLFLKLFFLFLVKSTAV